MSDNRLIIAGLGNPGKQYERNRHNIGFMAVDALARAHGLKFDKMMSKGLVALGEIKGKKVALVKPQTFMNNSGECVVPVVRFYKSEPTALLVCYDELDIPAGQLRMRAGGSAGGHNGMKSIINRLGTPEFPRLRIGIGRPPGRMDAAAFVLQDFAKGEQTDVDLLLGRCVTAIEFWLTDGITLAMNRVNTIE
jgi:peptidyl-tRNA hydrolase, PTH1 family